MKPSKYNTLLQEKADLVNEGRDVFTKAEAEERELTAEEQTRDDDIQARLDEINPELDRIRRQRDREATTEAVEEVIEGDGTPAPPGPVRPFSREGEPALAAFGQQLAAVAIAGNNPHAVDPRLLEIQAATGMSEGVASEGGFLVQTDVTSELLELAHRTGILAGRTDRRPISANSNGIKINAIDESSRADGSRQGGIQAYWAAEAGTLTKSKPTFRQMELALQKLTGLYYATDEELKDTTALAANIARWFGEEFGFKIDDAIIRGTGAGMPLGILGHAGTVSVAKETGQVAATVLKENIEKMWARVWAPSLARGEWYINQDVWPQLFQLSQAVGVGGVPVYIPPGGMAAAPFGSLMGRPVTPIEQCETLGVVGDLIFADFGKYIMIEKGGIEAAVSIHVQFLTDETTFRFILRTDGQPKRNAPLTPYKGTNTQSSFVTLATRA